MSPIAAVLDASAVLALLFEESGAATVAEVLPRAVVSAANWVEVAQRGLEKGIDPTTDRHRLEAIGLAVVPLTAQQAEDAAGLRAVTRHLGLSLADRCCLALARETGCSVLTADAAWARADLGAEVVLIR